MTKYKMCMHCAHSTQNQKNGQAKLNKNEKKI